MSISAMKQALEALHFARLSIDEWSGYASDYFQNKYDLKGDIAEVEQAITALRTAIEAAEKQKPVAWVDVHDYTNLYYRKPSQVDVVPLYYGLATPPAAPVQEPEIPDCGEAGHAQGCCGNRECLPSFRRTKSAAQPAVPLTPAQYNVALACVDMRPSQYEAATRAIERAHGITEQKGGAA